MGCHPSMGWQTNRAGSEPWVYYFGAVNIWATSENIYQQEAVMDILGLSRQARKDNCDGFETIMNGITVKRRTWLLLPIRCLAESGGRQSCRSLCDAPCLGGRFLSFSRVTSNAAQSDISVPWKPLRLYNIPCR